MFFPEATYTNWFQICSLLQMDLKHHRLIHMGIRNGAIEVHNYYHCYYFSAFIYMKITAKLKTNNKPYLSFTYKFYKLAFKMVKTMNTSHA